MTDMAPYDDGFQLALEYAPTRYDPFDPAATGSWFTLMYQGAPMGVVWHDGKNGAGFLQADEDLVPGTSVMGASMLNTFSIMRKSDIPAGAAYNLLKATPGIRVENEKSGKLVEAIKTAHSLKSAAAAPSLTAAGVMADSPSVVAVFNADSEEFLEIVRSDASGVYLRDSGSWYRLPDEDDSLDGTEWIWIDADGLAYFDSLSETGQSPTREQMLEYQLPN